MCPMKRIEKRRFSLIEIAVCIALVAVIAGCVGVKLNTLLGESRYRHSVKRLYNEIETLQVLALVLGSDVHVEMDKKEFKIICDEPMIKKRAKVQLEGVNHILLDKRREKKIKFTISSKGWIDLPGPIELCHGDEKVKIHINTIKIYPNKQHPIIAKPKEKHAPVDTPV